VPAAQLARPALGDLIGAWEFSVPNPHNNAASSGTIDIFIDGEKIDRQFTYETEPIDS
jgi:hypothetical protein